MHKVNSVPLSSHPHLNSDFYSVEVHYQSKTTGLDTTDVDDAVADFDGNPLVLEFKPSTIVDKSISNPPRPLSFSPCDPVSRMQCFEVFGMLNKKPSSPISMVDKMEAHGYAERVSNAISNSISNAVNIANDSLQSSSNHSPENLKNE